MDVKRAVLTAAALAAAAVPLYVADLGSWVLVSNDEARFPVMARDILASGRWLLPEIAATPMLNKPPLFAWLIALVSLPGGAVTARTAALPSVLAALGVVLATAWLGARLFGRPAGLSAGLVTATTGGFFSFAHVPLPDTTLTLAITLAMIAFVRAELEDRRGWLVGFYGATGLAFLAKGPVGLIPVAIALVFELIVHGRTGARRLLSPAGLALLGLLVVPWPLLALGTGGPAFVDKVLLKDMQDTYVGLAGFRWQRLTHPIVLAATHLVPWVAATPLAIWSVAHEREPERARRLGLALVWAGTAFVLIAIAERQRLRYYLPLVPPVALLVAAWHQRLPPWRKTALVSAACVALVVLGLGLEGRYEAHGRARSTNVDDVARAMKSARAPVFAVDSPDIVLQFYLEQPVVPLTYYSQFERIPGPAYLIAAERIARAASASVERLAVARVNGRTFVLLRKS